MTVNILCVSDGGITRDMMENMRSLESYGAEVTIVEDTEMDSMARITDRMGLLEQHGVNAAPTCPAVLDHGGDADILVVHVATINEEVLAACPHLKVAAVLRGGYENADVEALRSHGVTLINAPWRSANAVADFAVGMMIAENKNIARSHQMLFNGKWCKKFVNQDYIHDMRTRTVGIVGFGYIGSRVAKRLSGFESRVIAHDPFVDPGSIRKAGVEPVDDLTELLHQSDFVTLHLRSSEQTQHIIDAKALSQMKPTAYLINTARSSLVDEAALASALRNREIGGAAIDVYDTEPLPTDHPYLSLDNITLTSHLAGTSADTMQTSVEIGVADLRRYLQGEPMVNVRA